MSRAYHLDCLPTQPDPPRTTFAHSKTNKYTRTYYKSCKEGVENLYQGQGCSHINRHVNPNFRIPRAVPNTNRLI